MYRETKNPEYLLEKAIKTIKRNCTDEDFRTLREMPEITESVVSTGIPALDEALGVGGFCKGTIIEISGPAGAGKTSLAFRLIRQYQDTGKPVLYINSERALSKDIIKAAGADEDNLYLLTGNSLENSFSACIAAAPAFSAIVIDSLTGLLPDCSLRDDITDRDDRTAKIVSHSMPMLINAIAANDCTLIIINQLRERLGVMFGNPEVSTGGRAIKHYSAMRLDIRRRETLKQKGDITGFRAVVKVNKNKVAAPYREAEIDFIFGGD